MNIIGKLRRIRVYSFVMLYSLLIVGARVATAAEKPVVKSAAPPMLRVDGNKLKTPEGRVVRLSGVNIPSLEWSNAGERIAQSVKVAIDDWGSNCLRLPLSQDRWFGMEGGQTGGGASYRQVVDDAIKAASDKGVYVVLDLHWSNAGTWNQANGQHKMPDLNSQVFWIDVAHRYANHPAVLFDLYNEPHDISWDVWRDGGDVGEKIGETEVWYRTPGMQKLLEIVRATGADNIVVAGGLDWAYDLSGVADKYALTDKDGNGVMYATHIYPWKGASADNWNPHIAAAAAKFPILVGEVGCEPNEKHEDPMTWAPKVLKYIDDLDLNWAAWCFHPKATPAMLLDWNYKPTPYWGEFVQKALLRQRAIAQAETAKIAAKAAAKKRK